MTRIISNLAEISADYSAAFVDLWGCVHDGVNAFPDAVAALQAYRASGGRVILVTNSPRPRPDVAKQLQGMGVPSDVYDAIATSGDSARAAMYRGVVGSKVWFIGQPHETTFFDPINVVNDPVDITRVDLNDAEGIVCCGPVDPLADPSEYRAQFLLAKQKGLKLLCANPDIVVDRGEQREWCAGALAKLYTEMGGESLYFGKPHPPIYDLARRRLDAVDMAASEGRILAIGDGIATDIAGAMGEDIDSLFISGGLARAETRTTDHPDPAALDAYLAEHSSNATYAIGMLR